MDEGVARLRRDHDHEMELEDPHVAQFENSFKPRTLRRCINDVFKETVPSANNGTLEPCMDNARSRAPRPTPEMQQFRRDMKVEARQFHDCLCELHTLTGHCRFNLLMVQSNKTVLTDCMDADDNHNVPFSHPVNDAHFLCELRNGQRIRCVKSSFSVEPKTTRFQYVLNCLSKSLKGMTCPASYSTPSTPLSTTAAAASGPDQGKLIIFIMALVISLLLGVLATWLGVFCWRRRKRRRREKDRSLPALMPRPEHASLPNLYDAEYTEDHIYDIVKPDDYSPSNPVPDLLSRVPSLPPMNDRTPRSSKVQVDPDNSEVAYKKEIYEPLLPGETSVYDPGSPPSITQADYLPLLPDRNSCVIPEEEEETEGKGENPEGKKDSCAEADSSKPKKSGNDYFILEPHAQKLAEGVSPTVDSGYVHEHDAEGEQDSDGYEIPVSPGSPGVIEKEDVVNV